MKNLFIILLLISQIANAGTYYVSTTGNNGSSGTKVSPWLTWSKAFRTAVAGDTVYFRGGTYSTDIKTGMGIRYDTTGHNGTAVNPICYFNYPGEIPILDCKEVNLTTVYNWGFIINGGKYLYFKGLQIKNVTQEGKATICVGLQTEMNYHVKFENMTIHHIGGVGFMTNYSVFTEIINCDAYNCIDSIGPSPGAWGSGFAGANEKFDEGYTSYYGCRAWNCSDQGYTSGGQRGTVVYDHCWSYDIGLLEAGEGFCFKLGYMNINPSAHDPHVIMKNCIGTHGRYGGITTNDQGHYGQFLYVYNNFFYDNNKYGVFILNPVNNDLRRTFRNNISFQPGIRGDYVLNTYNHSNNSWDTGHPTVTDGDFVNLDYSQLKTNRKSDGSLPDINFGKLQVGSDLIDAGIDVGLPYVGDAPDLGWDEFGDEIISNPGYISNGVNFLKDTRDNLLK